MEVEKHGGYACSDQMSYDQQLEAMCSLFATPWYRTGISHEDMNEQLQLEQIQLAKNCRLVCNIWLGSMS